MNARRRIPFWIYLVASVVLLWALAYTLDTRYAAQVAASSVQPTPAENWDRLEQKVEQSEWFSAPQLRATRTRVAAERKAEQDPIAGANEQAALARIDARLQQLRSVR